jgi:hypothetical protein
VDVDVDVDVVRAVGGDMVVPSSTIIPGMGSGVVGVLGESEGSEGRLAFGLYDVGEGRGG